MKEMADWDVDISFMIWLGTCLQIYTTTLALQVPPTGMAPGSGDLVSGGVGSGVSILPVWLKIPFRLDFNSD